MAKTIMPVLVCLLALVLSHTAKVNAVDCGTVLTSIFPCFNFLNGEIPLTPSADCCRGAGSVLGTSLDINGLCQCFRANPLVPGLLQSKAAQLPTLCNLPSLLPLVNCMFPSGNGALPFPSIVPIPPSLVPIPPVVPIAFPPVA